MYIFFVSGSDESYFSYDSLEDYTRITDNKGIIITAQEFLAENITPIPTLEQGMIVSTRNGMEWMVFQNGLVNMGNSCPLEDFDLNLTNQYTSDIDIITVHSVEGALIWERPQESFRVLEVLTCPSTKTNASRIVPVTNWEKYIVRLSQGRSLFVVDVPLLIKENISTINKLKTQVPFKTKFELTTDKGNSFLLEVYKLD